MVVDGNTGVDARVLRHQIADLQQDVTGIPEEEGDGKGETGQERDKGASEHGGKSQSDGATPAVTLYRW